MGNYAAYQRKLKTFRAMMQSSPAVTYNTMIQDPMYPTDPTRLIPGDTPVTEKFTLRLIRTRSVDENYTEGGAGFIPETFKWVLSLSAIPEGANFTLHGANYETGRPETLYFQDRIYGYRSPVNVRCS